MNKEKEISRQDGFKEGMLAERKRCVEIAREFEYRESGLGHLIDKDPKYPIAKGIGTAIATAINQQDNDWKKEFDEWTTGKSWELDKEKFYVDITPEELIAFIEQVEADAYERGLDEAEGESIGDEEYWKHEVYDALESAAKVAEGFKGTHDAKIPNKFDCPYPKKIANFIRELKDD